MNDNRFQYRFLNCHIYLITVVSSENGNEKLENTLYE